MGKANRARRAAKKRRDHRAGGSGRAGGRSSGWDSTTRPDLRYVIADAAYELASDGERRCSDRVVEEIMAVAAQVGTAGTALVIDGLFCDCLEQVWEAGWRPAEVVRVLRRRLGRDHADLAATAVAAQHTLQTHVPPDEWSDQLHDLNAGEPWWGAGRDWIAAWAIRHGTAWASALRWCVEALAVLSDLRPVTAVTPPPSQWGLPGGVSRRVAARVDEGVLAKVRALLAKAESTNFEHEAEALTAKAQELMSRHAIDEAIAAGEGAAREKPMARRLPVDDPYAGPKSTLLAVVASANGVRAVWDEDYALMTVIGFESDLEAVEVLFTSLFMQASRAVLAKGRIRDERGRSRTRSFRQSFYVAFAQRIHERLVAAASQARQSAEQELGRDLLPVLAGRREEVDEATARVFPHLSRARIASVTNADGWRAGRAAAEMATLGPRHAHLESAAG